MTSGCPLPTSFSSPWAWRKDKHTFVRGGGGCRLLLPYAGEGGVDFSREGARPGPSPRSSRHPPPLTSPESCQNQLRTGLCVLGRPRRGIRDRLEEQRGAEGGGEGTSIRQVVSITHPPPPSFQPHWAGRGLMSGLNRATRPSGKS